MTQQENSLMRKEGESGGTSADANRYEGERDAQGRRHGKGNFFFADGSSYSGEWREGLRHGVGQFNYADKSVYKGMWNHDLKHGPGKFWFADGDIVLGMWQCDRLNGLAKLHKKGASDAEEVIYKDDMLINSTSTGLSCGEVTYITFAILLMLTTYAAIPMGLIVQNDYFYLGFAALFYWIYSCCTSSTKYIMNNTPLQ